MFVNTMILYAENEGPEYDPSLYCPHMLYCPQMGRAMRKRVFGHVCAAKTQIRLRIRAV